MADYTSYEATRDATAAGFEEYRASLARQQVGDGTVSSFSLVAHMVQQHSSLTLPGRRLDLQIQM